MSASDAYITWGTYHRNSSNKLDEAISCYEKALEVKQDDHYVWHNRGIVLIRSGYLEEAIACYDKALELKPDDSCTKRYREKAFLVFKQLEETIANYDKALEATPDDDSLWYNRGIFLIRLNRSQQAIASLDKAIEINLNNYQAWFRIGTSFLFADRDKHPIIKPENYLTLEKQESLNLSYRERLKRAVSCFEKVLETKPKESQPTKQLESNYYNNTLYDHYGMVGKIGGDTGIEDID